MSMETASIAEAVQLCVQGLTDCRAVTALMDNEWAENRLADMNLWISGTGACARGRASLDARLASRPEARDVITNLLRLLATVIDECRTLGQAPRLDNDQTEGFPCLEEESGDRAFSPWSDDSSSDDDPEDGFGSKPPSKIPLKESMYNVESMEDQLARIAVAIRRSGRRSRLQKADQRFDASEHQELEGHLIAMLLTQLKHKHKSRDPSALNEVQLRLVRCNLKRRNRFLYAQQHSIGLGGGIMHRSHRTAAANNDGRVEGDIADQKDQGNNSKTGNQNPNATVITGTSASALSDSFMMPQAEPAAPAASSIMSTTVIDLDYPHPPRFGNDAHIFRCPCCCEAIPTAVADKNKWRKHVADDLSPYTCILTGCSQPDVLFSTKDAWKQHLLKDHSSTTCWICFACGNGARFYSKESFVQHTTTSHASSILPNQIASLVEICKKSTPTHISQCPLCDWPEKGVEVEQNTLLNHIAKELHSFSLRALPWADDNGHESEERIHYSSVRVCNWLLQRESQSPISYEKPSRPARVAGLEYFQQNSYFAGSSRGSSSSEPESDGSRQLTLDELHGELKADEEHQADDAQSIAVESDYDMLPVPAAEEASQKAVLEEPAWWEMSDEEAQADDTQSTVVEPEYDEHHRPVNDAPLSLPQVDAGGAIELPSRLGSRRSSRPPSLMLETPSNPGQRHGSTRSLDLGDEHLSQKSLPAVSEVAHGGAGDLNDHGEPIFPPNQLHPSSSGTGRLPFSANSSPSRGRNFSIASTTASTSSSRHHAREGHSQGRVERPSSMGYVAQHRTRDYIHEASPDEPSFTGSAAELVDEPHHHAEGGR